MISGEQVQSGNINVVSGNLTNDIISYYKYFYKFSVRHSKVYYSSCEVWVDLTNPEHTTPLHLRGGYIIPIQDPVLMNNTVEQRNSNMFKLIVAMDE